jgi:hypothetical protein
MNIDKVLEFIDDRIFYFKNHRLSSLQKIIITGAWEGLTYEQIAVQDIYGTGYIAEIAYKLWNELSEIFGKNIRKNNFRSAIQRLYLGISSDNNDFKIERSIEFPPEYWTAGTSILSYFTHILSVKYPNQNIKVKIEQEGLLLRMIIDTSEGQRELIEQTLNEYGMVIAGKLLPESFLNNPFEVMALENKLETMKLELRQSEKLRALEKEMYSILSDKDRQRIDSLEVKVDQLSDMLEKSLSGDTKPIVNVNVNANDHSSQNSINQHGTRDNIGNDKVGNDKIGRDKIEKE